MCCPGRGCGQKRETDRLRERWRSTFRCGSVGGKREYSECRKRHRSQSLQGSAPQGSRVGTLCECCDRENHGALDLETVVGLQGPAECGESGKSPGEQEKQSFWIFASKPELPTYRRGRENEPGGIGTVTKRLPSVEEGSSLPEARTSLKGVMGGR
ncbi:hypothetical protein BC628DRAFT_61577 [Trametes gibbosa]|nr:hypothetical protein BC628DRAFT_61577 [Trametes gibbosa]